jgi:hypothetical protein
VENKFAIIDKVEGANAEVDERGGYYNGELTGINN